VEHQTIVKNRGGSDEVETWMAENFAPAAKMDAFVNNVLVAVLQLLSVGVLYYPGRSTEDDPETAHELNCMEQ
jgi:hypothetical protein